MASVRMEGGKHTTKQACSGNIPHDYRERDNYSNKDIDSSRTYLNEYYGCQTGEEARAKLRKRIAECDSMHPPMRKKSDRKTSLEMHIVSPRMGLPDDKNREFFRLAYEELTDLFGEANMIYGATHFDEIHKYYDPNYKQYKESREGMHVVVIPWTDGQDWIPDKYKAGLNMNNFYRKNLPKLINKRLDKVCQQVYGFDYQDGSKTSNKATVEELKAISNQYEDIIGKVDEAQSALKETNSEIKVAEQIRDEKIEEIADMVTIENEKIDYKYDKLFEYEKKVKSEASSVQKKEKQIIVKMKQVLEKNTGTEYPDDFDAVMSDFGEWVDSVLQREADVSEREADVSEREADVEEREAQSIERDAQFELDSQALKSREKAFEAKEKSLEKQKQAELNRERKQLQAENKRALNDEKIKLQQEHDIKLLQDIKKQGIDVQEFNKWKRQKDAEAIKPINSLPKREKPNRELPI